MLAGLCLDLVEYFSRQRKRHMPFHLYSDVGVSLLLFGSGV